MNTPRLANPRRLAIIGGLMLIITLGLLFSARELVRELVVLPVSYLLWAANVFIITTPQIVFWGALLIFGGMAAYRTLAGRRKRASIPPPEPVDNGQQRPLQGRVAYWSLRINLLRQSEGGYFVDAFHQSLGRVLFDVLGHRYRMTFHQVEEALRENALPVPPEVREYALNSLRRSEGGVLPFKERLRRRVRAWLAAAAAFLRGQPQAQDQKPAGRDEQWVIQVIQYLEEELEVSNDDSGR